MSTLSGSIEGARGSPVEVHEYLASNLHPGRRQVCAPFLMFVNGACSSVHLRSAIDHQRLARDEVALRRAEKHRGADDVLRKLR